MNPETLTFDDVQAARNRLTGVAHRTPIVTSHTLNSRSGRRIVLKCENLQRGGAFKFRGAFNTISQIPPDVRRRGVLAFSSGNHAQGVALAARVLAIPSAICMPQDAPAVKIEATRNYGAEIIFYDRLRDDREALARRIASERGMTLIPPYDHPQIMAGAGTATLELLEDAPDIDTLLVPIGGGGLISGSSVAAHGVNPKLRVIGVEPQDADDTRRSLAVHARTAIPAPTTIADGLRAQIPGMLTFPIIQAHVADVLTVTDAQILEAIRFALLWLKLVVEPSGAVGLAAALFGLIPPDALRVGIIISGGNIDPQLIAGLWAPAGATA